MARLEKYQTRSRIEDEEYPEIDTLPEPQYVDEVYPLDEENPPAPWEESDSVEDDEGLDLGVEAEKVEDRSTRTPRRPIKLTPITHRTREKPAHPTSIFSKPGFGLGLAAWPVRDPNEGALGGGKKPSGEKPSTFPKSPAPVSEEDESLEFDLADEEAWAQEEAEPQRFRLLDVIEKHPTLPGYSMILGVCEDTLPLVMDLFDPTPGAVLILGDDPGDNRYHLQSILASARLLNTPRQVEIDLITPDVDAFYGQASAAHFRQVLSPKQMDAFDLLGSLFDLVEMRQRKGSKRPVKILAVDQVDVLVGQLASESLAYLRWLLRRGPSANIWIIGTAAADRVSAMDWKTFRAFGLHLIGNIASRRAATQLTDIPANQIVDLIPGMQACVKLEDEVLQFEIPDFE